MNLPEDIAFIVGLILGFIELFRSKGQDLLAWAIVAICAGLLWHVVT